MKIKGQEIFLGCDPEVGVVNPKGEFVGAWDLGIVGTKERPQLIKNGMVQVDGMALEFGIDPASTETQFVSRIQSVMKTIQKMLPKGYKLHQLPSVVYSDEELRRAPPEALELGCDPDYNAYTLEKNPRPVPPERGFRTHGGHVHIGWGQDLDCGVDSHMTDCGALAVELDYLLGIPSLAWDSDVQRRKLYGAPGAFRPKSYGMEYRTLSNSWIFSEQTIRFVYRNTIRAVGNLLNNNSSAVGKISLYSKEHIITAARIIDKNHVALGKRLYEEALGV